MEPVISLEMSLVSVPFAALVAVLFALHCLVPQKARWAVLLAGSLAFYWLAAGWLLAFVVASAAVIYGAGLLIERRTAAAKQLEKGEKERKKALQASKRRIMVAAVAVNLAILCITKYFGFIVENANAVAGLFGAQGIGLSTFLVPLGISYYTLDAISYLVDLYHGKFNAERNYLHLLLYLSFFPKITEGPFVRYGSLSAELFTPKPFCAKRLTVGADLVMLGLFKKMVVADRCGIFVNAALGDPSCGGAALLLALLLYAVQLYADFAGCIDIVRGVSFLFNVELPRNFNHPFFSRSVQEFWQRWHITLGAWLKEYVFYAVALSRFQKKATLAVKKRFGKEAYKFASAAIPLLFVWVLMGLWHGAAWKYVLYGMYFFVLMLLGMLITPRTAKIWDALHAPAALRAGVQTVLTCLFVVVGFSLFRAESVAQFLGFFSGIAAGASGDVLAYGLVPFDFAIIAVGVAAMLLLDLLEERGRIALDDGFTQSVIVRGVAYAAIIVSLVAFGIYGPGYDASAFIYGGF